MKKSVITRKTGRAEMKIFLFMDDVTFAGYIESRNVYVVSLDV